MEISHAAAAPSLFQQVAVNYAHNPKFVRPASALSSPGVYLKWYLIQPEARPISDADCSAAQAFVQAEILQNRLALKQQIGFVVQHRCTGVDILYVCSWRNDNEVWETLYHQSIGQRFSI